MDLDHLKKLLDAALEEGEALNDAGPAYEMLVAYLDGLQLLFVCKTCRRRTTRRVLCNACATTEASTS